MKRIQGALRNRGLLYFYMPTSKDIIYYTDFHNVDEDLKTVIIQGGDWVNGTALGITQRDLYSPPTSCGYSVASYVCEHHLLHPDGYHNVGHKIPTDQSIHMYPYLYKFS